MKLRFRDNGSKKVKINVILSILAYLYPIEKPECII